MENKRNTDIIIFRGVPSAGAACLGHAQWGRPPRPYESAEDGSAEAENTSVGVDEAHPTHK